MTVSEYVSLVSCPICESKLKLYSCDVSDNGETKFSNMTKCTNKECGFISGVKSTFIDAIIWSIPIKDREQEKFKVIFDKKKELDEAK
jgi:hypothetical protein